MFKRLGGERGSVLALTAIMMVAMLGMTALVTDVGNWYITRRALQNAADAAALAGSDDLPGNAAQAQTDALTYINANASGASHTITTPYNSNSSDIKVTVTKTVGGIFGGVLGLSSQTVSASAVAAAGTSGSPSFVFAKDDSCSDQGITMNGNDLTISGGTHSNGTFYSNANDSNYGTTTYGGPNGCGATLNGNNDTFGSSSTPTKDSTNYPWPYDFSSLFPAACQGSGAITGTNFTWNNNDATIPSGIYCATGTISINGNNLSCAACTFYAPNFNLNGNNESFSPYSGMHNLVIYQTGTGVMNINGNSYLNGGSIFVPDGEININGNSGTATGFLEANTITITGNDFTFTGNGPSLTSSAGGLLQ